MKIELNDYITINQATALLNNTVSTMTVHRWCSIGKLECIKWGGALLIKKSSVEELVNSKK